MNGWEIARLFCYVVSVPALIYVALAMLRSGLRAQAMFYGAIALLFMWFVAETTMTGAGINTRALRALATPLVALAAMAALWIAGDLLAQRRPLHRHDER